MSLTRQDIENWVPEPAPSKGGSGLVAKLFAAITKSMASLTKISSEANSELYRQWRNEYERFFLWGQGLSILDGDLDEVLAVSKELHFQVLSLLLQVGTAVLQALCRKTLPSSQVLADECDNLRNLLVVIENLLQEPEPDQQSRPHTPSDVSECEERDVLEEIAIYIDCLLDLSSSLENPALDLPATCVVEPKNAEESFNISSEEELIYCRKIRDRFEALPKYLVERLATANVSRFAALRDMRSRPTKYEVPVDDVVTEKLFSTTDARFTETTQSKATPSSLFSAPAQPTTDCSEASISGHPPMVEFDSNESEATFASFSTSASSVNSGRPRVPPMPERQGDGLDCPVCFSHVRYVESRKDWKKHVIGDLKPYICTVEHCKDTETLYHHSQAWAQHEDSHSSSDSLSPECPFCSATYHKRGLAYYKHVSRHLREISLSVLPQSADDDESGPATSSESSSISDLPNKPHSVASLLKDLGKFDVPGAQDGMFPCSTNPLPPNEHFYGRETELAEIRNHLSNAPSGNQLRSLALHGLGGVGKTQLALAYAYEQMDAGIDAILWFSCGSDQSLARSFASAAISLKLHDIPYEHTWEENKFLVLDWLQSTSRTWLCVFDNVEDHESVRDLWPGASDSGQVLITCREYIPILPVTGVIAIKPFDRDQGCQVILRYLEKPEYSDAEVEAARQLADGLGGFPFALVSMAAHIRKRKLSISSFLQLYEKHAGKLNRTASVIGPDYQDPLVTVWQTTFEQLSHDARTLLGIMAYLAPDCVPADLFRASGDTSLPEGLEFCREPDLYDEALEELLTTSLIQSDLEKDVYSVHRLVQMEFRSCMSEEEQHKAFVFASHLLRRAFPMVVYGLSTMSYWPKCKRYARHVLALCAGWKASKFRSVVNGDEIETFPTLATSCGWYLMETGAWSEGMMLVDTAMELCQDQQGLRYADLAHCRAGIATQRGHCAEAYEYMKVSLEILQRIYGANHAEVGLGISSYASIVLQDQGTGACQEAIGLYHKALDIFRAKESKIYEEMSYIPHSNFARAYLVLGQYDEAIRHAEESRTWALKCLGAGNYFEGLAECHIGNALYALERYDAAEKCWLRAFEIFSDENKVHPSTNAAQMKLAMIKMMRGDFSEAISMLEDVLRIAKQLEHSKGDKGEVARVQRKLAQAYRLSGYFAEADSLRYEAEEMRREIQGDRFSELPDCDMSYAMMSFHAYW